MFSRTLRCSTTVPVIVLFYPCRSLTGQVKHWLERHGGHLSQISFARTLPEIRRRMRRADTVIVDASDDAALASDAFLQSMLVMGPDTTAVYTERSAADLERLVRCFGVPFLLGPMNLAEWDAHFQRQFDGLLPFSGSQVTAPSIPASEEFNPFSGYRRRAG
ncbi:MAG: hypothetical protein JXB10_08950 [Pirellulales bacterium]|nr:hypothetical protein [Pirellulales bacterium]